MNDALVMIDATFRLIFLQIIPVVSMDVFSAFSLYF
jgi:hypothetical protein